jgi:hypothetical protein
LVPETQSYLVTFVEYGNSQLCTPADLAPLDIQVTKAAPAPLVEDSELDPVFLEAQRKARVAERQEQLRAEEAERKRLLEEKRKAVQERKTKLEALDKEEKMAQLEEQRRKLEAAAQVEAQRQKLEQKSAEVPASEAPLMDKTQMLKRMTLSAAGGSGQNLGMLKGVTMKELKQAALNSPLKETPTKKSPLDMKPGEGVGTQVLDFGSGDTPTKKAMVEQIATPTAKAGAVEEEPEEDEEEEDEEEVQKEHKEETGASKDEDNAVADILKNLQMEEVQATLAEFDSSAASEKQQEEEAAKAEESTSVTMILKNLEVRVVRLIGFVVKKSAGIAGQ